MLLKKMLVATIVLAFAFCAVAVCWFAAEAVDFNKNYFVRTGQGFAGEEDETPGEAEETPLFDVDDGFDDEPDGDIPDIPEKIPDIPDIPNPGEDDKYKGLEDDFDVDIDPDDSMWDG